MKASLGLLLPALLWAQAKPEPFTLEQILSSAFPSELVAAPAAGRVAWVLDDRGARNIWVAEPPAWRGRRITTYQGDDGQEIYDLAWTPDASAVVYVRGEVHGGGPANPDVGEAAVWIVPIAGGTPRLLGEGHAPAVSPRGDRVAFLTHGQVWVAPLDSAQQAQPILSVGQWGLPRWSPDGARLAVVSYRDESSAIGVYDLARKAVRYLDAGLELDGSPVWSPDGARIAFVREPMEEPRMIDWQPLRSGPPWSIRVAEVASGRGREVFRARPGRGSVFQPRFDIADDAARNLLWAAGDRLVFPWERDGWLNLYAVVASGGEPVPLTPGNYEVEQVSLSPDRRDLLYCSNQNDPERRHIYRLALAGGGPRRLTEGAGIEWSPVMNSTGRAIAFLRSDARRPSRVSILPESGAAQDLAPSPIPADFPSARLIEPQRVTFRAADGIEIPGYLLFEPRPAGERRPAVVYFHGGPNAQELLGWHPHPDDHAAYGAHQWLAARGYVVLVVNFRGSRGYGLEFREPDGLGSAGASEFQDVAAAARYLASRADVDPKRIGLWGSSYGGYLTALGLARASDVFAAGVSIAGVYDWVARGFELQSHLAAHRYDFEAQRVQIQRAFESSPLAHVRAWRSPILLIHGGEDDSVRFSQSVRLARALREEGVEFEQLVFPDEGHGFLRHANQLESLQAAVDFFERRLKGRP